MLDMVAMTVGFAMAALLLQVFWGSASRSGSLGVTLLLLIYCWLGLCMSGPLILLLERRGRPRTAADRDARTGAGRREPPGRSALGSGFDGASGSRYTRCERAWMSIGAYWIGAAAFCLPIVTRDVPSLLLLILQTVALVGLWALVPGRRPPVRAETAWTHRLAVALILSWPLAWAASIYLAIGLR